MKLKLVSALAAVALSLTFTAAAAETVAAATPFSFAVIGDTPYGSTQLSVFPQRIGQINADSQVQLVTHLGDIGGPPDCSDSYYATIRADFDTFVDPLVYTPGDNEWADCSGASVGAANPLDRLAAVRRVFFPAPGTTLGQNPASVTAQSGYPENVLYDREGLTFAAVHIVGSANDLATWSGYSAPTSAQTAEVNARTDADVALIHAAFERATANASRAVVFTTQADMFKGTPSRTAYEPLVKAFASESLTYQLPVFLFNGDTHSFASDRPLTSSTWLSYYGLTTPVPNFSRITVEGGPTLDEWLKVTVVDTPAVLAVQRVPFTVNAAPVASFTASTSGLTAAFDAGASTDDAGITGYGWTFGDGSTGTGVSPSHSYAAAGTYSVTLTVTDTQGATGTKTAPVTVSSSGSVTDVVVPAKSAWKYRYSTAAPDAVWKNPGYDSSAWNTGPGTLGYGSTPLGTNLNPSATTSARPLAAYFLRSFSIPTASAVTALKLTTIADDGVVVYVNGTEVGRSRIPAGTVTINTYATAAIPTSSANAAPVTFDVPLSLLVNGTNTIAVETHLNYHATKDISFDLTATTTTNGATVNAAPVASFTASTSGLTAAFDAGASTDDAGITGYGWTFGDGSTGTGVSPSHSYAAAGTYSVTLTVTDTQGATGTKTAPVTVSSSGSVTDVVVPAKSAWKYRYSTAAPDAVWKNPGYDSSAWNTGPGTLGYGSTPLGTNLNPSATTSARPLAAYFLRSFSIPTASAVTALKLTTIADDGVVVYVNGTEVGRSRIPAGTVTINTYATAAIPTSSANAAPVTFDVPLSLLVNGTNTIAVETHLNYHATKDISFDLTATTTTNG